MMSRPESRSGSASVPPAPQNAAMSKTDDSGSSHTPGGAAENSVAYQYVAVQQMTSCRDQIEYQLTVREQPKQSRMCGVGEKADRRPIDPAPIVHLRVITHDRPIRQSDLAESGPVAPPVERRPGHGVSSPKTPGVRRGLPVTTALGDGWEDKAWYLENPYYFMYAMLCNAETDEELHLLNDGKTRYTSGSCVSCLYHLKDIDGSHQGFFVFPDLSIRVEGRYRLKLCLFETIGHTVHHCKSIYSDPFHVYTAKRFPGMEESTRLSKSFAEQGLKVRVRKHPRSRRRGSKRTKDESDASDDAPLARQASPKRARVSDIMPTSGLPIPQPYASSRMPRSLDARFERADYDRKPLSAAVYHEAQAAPPARHAPWEEEEALRLRESRGWDPRYDAAPMYARHAREDDGEERRLPPREFVDGRYMDADHPSRTRSAAPPHAGVPTRSPPDFYDYGRSAYLRDEPARPLYDPPRRLSATSPPPPPPPLSSHMPTPSSSHPSLVARGYPEPSASSAAPHGRSYPAAPAPMPLRPARIHSRSYDLPDHAGPPSQRIYDDYGPPPSRVDPRYGASHDPRDHLGSRLSPPSPPPPVGGSSADYSNGRIAYLSHAPASQWRSGPPSPNRPSEYHLATSGAVEAEYMARRSPARSSARGIITPPAAYVGGGEPKPPHRRGYGLVDPPGRPAAAYDAPASVARPLPGDPYVRDDMPLSGRYVGGLGIASSNRERPILPPLSAASPSAVHREREVVSARDRDAAYVAMPRDREAAYVAMPRDREAAFGPAERYLSPSGYLPRGGGGVSEMEQRDRDWERERMRAAGPPIDYRRDYAAIPPAASAATTARPLSREFPRPY